MDSSQLMGNIANAPIIPVVTLENAEQAIAVADALAEGGVTCIEVTLRTEAGLCAIEALAKQGSL
ncbi:MAG: keto-deoxy-phosphogluconate aldolase, partial [Rickettsiales bacterium]|nr:keto-deoxy-phosphogluconate aldolase [Rickettsiales bacterium]